MKIHSTAIIHPGAIISKNVEIGPFSVIDKDVKIDEGSIIHNNVTITGNTTIAKNNVIFPNSVIGAEPQDLKYYGEQSKLIIGSDNVIRECVTINTGTEVGGGETLIGDNNLFMSCSHIAHDCIIEDNVLVANGVLLGGHIKVEKHAKLMGLVGIQPFVTIGQHSYVGGLSRIVQDVPPYMIVEGNPAKVRKVNVIGLERSGFSQGDINTIKEVFKQLFRSETLNRNQILSELESQENLISEIKVLIEFFRNVDKGKFGRYRESLRSTLTDMS